MPGNRSTLPAPEELPEPVRGSIFVDYSGPPEFYDELLQLLHEAAAGFLARRRNPAAGPATVPFGVIGEEPESPA